MRMTTIHYQVSTSLLTCSFVLKWLTLVARHLLSSQHCFLRPGPPNFGISLHDKHCPQFSREQAEHCFLFFPVHVKTVLHVEYLICVILTSFLSSFVWHTPWSIHTVSYWRIPHFCRNKSAGTLLHKCLCSLHVHSHGIKYKFWFSKWIITFFSRSTFAPTRFLIFQSDRTLPLLVFKGKTLYFFVIRWALRLAALRTLGCNTNPSDLGNLVRNSFASSSSFAERLCKSLGFMQL